VTDRSRPSRNTARTRCPAATPPAIGTPVRRALLKLTARGPLRKVLGERFRDGDGAAGNVKQH